MVRREGKRAYDIGAMLRGIRAAVREYPKAALYELVEEGHETAFEQVVACIVSVRTRDERTLEVSRRLFGRARTAAAVAEMGVGEIEALLRGGDVSGAEGASDSGDRAAGRGGVRRGGALRRGGAAVVSLRRTEVREPGARPGVRRAAGEAALLHVPGARVLPPGGRDRAPLRAEGAAERR